MRLSEQLLENIAVKVASLLPPVQPPRVLVDIKFTFPKCLFLADIIGYKLIADSGNWLNWFYLFVDYSNQIFWEGIFLLIKSLLKNDWLICGIFR